MSANTGAADLATSANAAESAAVADGTIDSRDSSGNTPDIAMNKPMSKNQQKKLAKKERFAANKAAAKAAEKAAKQADTAKRREEVQQKFAEMTEEERDVWRSERQAKRQNRKSETGEKRLRLQQAVKEGQTIIIDCDFEEQMTDNEIKSLCGQLQYCYSSNIRAAKPCHLCFTSLKGKIAAQAEHQLSGLENWHITQTPKAYLDRFQEQKDSLVYLTADSSNELSELDPSKRYIIGGIVDRNRHKNICFKKADAQGIQTARLPIGAYMKLASSQVLTVNHVVEILLSWLELRDWQQAFQKVIPTRKRAGDTASGTTVTEDQTEAQVDAGVDELAQEIADKKQVPKELAPEVVSTAVQTVTEMIETAADEAVNADAKTAVLGCHAETLRKRMKL